MLGIPVTTPRWLASPNRRGWAMPCPSAIRTSGVVPSHLDRLDYLTRNTARLREVAVAAHRLGRQVVWG